jgi:hypothetical protein
VVSAERPASQPKVALYSEKTGDFPDSCYFDLPSYVVQTDSTGIFAFNHIRKGRYRMLSFTDANNDNKLQPGTEKIFAPVERAFLLDSAVGPVPLYGIECDTTPNRIVSVKPLSPSVISGIWAKRPDSLSTAGKAQWQIRRNDSSATTGASLRIKEFLPVGTTTLFYLVLGETLTMAPYRLVYSTVLPYHHGKNSTFNDSVRFNGINKSDTTRPTVQGFFPTGSTELKPRIKIVWSKPVQPKVTSWVMADSLKDTVMLSVAGGLSDSTIFTVKRSLKPDRLYRLKLVDTLFADIFGNRPRDTTMGKYTVRTISPETICYSVSGGASCLPRNTSRKWLFLPIGGSLAGVSSDTGGMFRFDTLAAGKGRIASLLDFNGDSIPTPGALFPWRKPEPYQVYADTIEARARWDIEGVEIRDACEQCVVKKAAPVVPDSVKQ